MSNFSNQSVVLNCFLRAIPMAFLSILGFLCISFRNHISGIIKCFLACLIMVKCARAHTKHYRLYLALQHSFSHHWDCYWQVSILQKSTVAMVAYTISKGNSMIYAAIRRSGIQIYLIKAVLRWGNNLPFFLDKFLIALLQAWVIVILKRHLDTLGKCIAAPSPPTNVSRCRCWSFQLPTSCKPIWFVSLDIPSYLSSSCAM